MLAQLKAYATQIVTSVLNAGPKWVTAAVDVVEQHVRSPRQGLALVFLIVLAVDLMFSGTGLTVKLLDLVKDLVKLVKSIEFGTLVVIALIVIFGRKQA